MDVTENLKKYRKEETKFIYDKNNIDIVNNYINQDKNKDKSELTIYPLKRTAIIFLSYLENKKINVENININVIEQYIKSLPDYYTRFTKKDSLRYLKDFLKYLCETKIISENLWLFVPNVRTSNYAKIPSVFNDDEIVKIFNAINRDNYTGKLIYAVSILSLRYGLRLIDIKNLKFENIDWKNGKINIIQSKTGIPLELPLLEDVADALIDYIKNARSTSKTNYIFVTKKGNKYSINNNFYDQFTKFVEKANLDNLKGRKIGIYSLKHSLASRLLKENIPLPIISSIFGHSSTLSTTSYIKVDNNQLEKCCLNMEDVYGTKL